MKQDVASVRGYIGSFRKGGGAVMQAVDRMGERGEAGVQCRN